MLLITASLSMCDRNGTVAHQTRKVRIIIDALVVLQSSDDASLRLGAIICVHNEGLPTLSLTRNVSVMIDQRRKMSFPLLMSPTICRAFATFSHVEIVICLAQDSRLLDRTDDFSRL